MLDLKHMTTAADAALMYDHDLEVDACMHMHSTLKYEIEKKARYTFTLSAV